MTQVQTEWCERWCREHASSWQVLNRSEWKYEFHARTLVRFVEEVNLREDEVTALLAYLASDNCIATLQLYDQSIGAEWKPIRAWLELSNKSHGNIHAVRLYHGLQTEDGERSEMFFVEDGCASKVWLTYYWNQPEVVQPVPASESGVSYRIGSVSVDPDTGLCSYVLEKRERVQQDLGPYVAKETVYERTTVESHHGVKADMVDSTGPAAGVADGTVTTRSLSKNADCTTDVEAQSVKDKPVAEAQKRVEKTLEGVVRTTADRNQPQPAAVDPAAMKPGSSVTVEKTDSGLYNNTVTEADETPLGVKGEDCRRTIYEHAHSTTENVPDRPTIDAPAASGGVVVKQSASMTRHGTWDVHTTEERERPVSGSVVSASKSLRAVKKSRTDRNQPAPLPMDGLEVGELRQSRKTEGGLYDNTTEQVEKTDVGDVGSDCAKTVFSHTDTKHENVAERPSGEADGAGGGKVTRKSVRETELGTFDVTTTEEREIAAPGASESVSVTLTGKTVVTENRNMESKAVPDGLGVGESVTNTETPGGRWNQTVRRVDRTLNMKVGESCGKTIYEHSHSTEELKGEDPGFSHAESASGGKTERKSVSRTSDGAYRVSTSETEERPVSAASRTVRKTLNGTVVRVENRNQPEPLDESGLRVGDSVTNSKTSGGLYNTVQELAPTEGAGLVSEHCRQDNFTHHHTKVENKGADAPDVAEHSFESGVIVDKAVALQSNGTKDVSTSTTTPKPWIQRYDWWSGDTHHFVVKYGNQPEEFAGTDVPRDEDVASVVKNDSVNAFDLHDGNVSWSRVPWRTSVGDLKFIKHGRPSDFYRTWVKPYDRKRYHVVYTVQTVHIRGDAYTDYLSAESRAKMDFSSSNAILGTKLIGKYQDKDGNNLAEWVELHGYVSEEHVCTKECIKKHGAINDGNVVSKIREIARRFDSSANTSESGDKMPKGLDAIANLLMAQFAMGSGVKFGDNGAISMPNGMSWNGESWSTEGGDGK